MWSPLLMSSYLSAKALNQPQLWTRRFKPGDRWLWLANIGHSDRDRKTHDSDTLWHSRTARELMLTGPTQCCGGISAGPAKSAGRISIFMTFKIVLPRL